MVKICLPRAVKPVKIICTLYNLILFNHTLYITHLYIARRQQLDLLVHLFPSRATIRSRKYIGFWRSIPS